MCILCLVAKWSRRIVAMLPWLIIPFVIVWAFSQFLPPGYRFEITSTRLACVGVLLGSLFWYEFIVPKLSQWREKRAVLLRERQRIEAQRAARWRKEATKHCRNCHSAYRDQSPQASGKYMCTNCGHASKKPELHVPGDPRPGNSKLDTRLSCSTCWRSLIEDLDKQRVFHLLLKYVTAVLIFLGWVWRHFCKHDRSGDDMSGRQQNAMEVDETQEKRERARRKAEERRLARLEREKKDEEERKDREEIKRLVDERSKLRAEQLEAENASKREVTAEKERELRRDREAEKKKQEKAKVKEKELATTEKISTEDSRTRNDKNSVYEKRKSHPGDYRGFRSSPSSTGTNVMHLPSSSKVRTPASTRNTSDVKLTSSPVPLREAGTPISWSKVLCGTSTTINKVEGTKMEDIKVPSKPVDDGGLWFSTNTTTTGLKWQPLPTELSATLSSPPRQENSPASPVSTDPIYFPGTTPVLAPISAPQHSTMTSDPGANTSLFSYFPPPTVLPPPTRTDTTFSVMSPTLLSPLSRAPPSLSSDFNWPAPLPQKNLPDSCIQLPEDICLSPSPQDSNYWLPQYDYNVDNVPAEFVDCITRDIMVDPVTTADGHSYDRATIDAWLKNNNTSPFTGIELPPAPAPDNVDRTLRPNHALRSQIIDFNERKARERAYRDGSVSPWPVTEQNPQKPQLARGLFTSPGSDMW